MADFRIETERLVLREWREEDLESLYPIGQDSRVMEFLGPRESPEDVQKLVAGQIVNQALVGHCFWPIERQSDSILLGYCGLQIGPAGTPLERKTEIGWRLAHPAWGQGYACEAALASLEWGFSNLSDEAIYAMTVTANVRSWGLMERLGMARRVDLDFDHPAVPDGSPLKRHITYRMDRPETAAGSAT